MLRALRSRRREGTRRCRSTRAHSGAPPYWRGRRDRARRAARPPRCRSCWRRPARAPNRSAVPGAPDQGRGGGGRGHRGPSRCSRPRQIHGDHGDVPVPGEDLEASLLFAPERVLVGEEALELRLGERLVRRRGVLPYERDATIPAAILGAVEPGRLRRDGLDVPQLHLALQHGVMVLLEQAEELLGVAPAELIVVLDHERLGRAGGWSLRPRHRGRRDQGRDDRPMLHASLPFLWRINRPNAWRASRRSIPVRCDRSIDLRCTSASTRSNPAARSAALRYQASHPNSRTATYSVYLTGALTPSTPMASRKIASAVGRGRSWVQYSQS